MKAAAANGRRAAGFACAILALLAITIAGSAAGVPPGGDPVGAEQAADIGADRAAAIARSASGGRVLGVRRSALGDHGVYEVKVLSADGVVRTLRIDARSGAVL